ncbi:hypothetical protein Q4Q34_02525 [Flavivirga abyssicola]|uniref:hypothetical protein n=1 Tax=Flavivirga abyssicola TaxID=3063533 RepID=UPI0026E0F2B7|nr:hypothetical protein [Flavivirga sp. MEBiC07777]WVK13910.1 hypothetical protein Q4Q34_02525 [Flavivirga sp. MEBiC07777]
MKKFIFIALIFSVSLSCKQKQEKVADIKPLTIAEKIANAHGFENWKHVTSIHFTFNVDKDSIHFERTWAWNTKTSDVLAINKKDTISYNRAKIDSTLTKVDSGFINDKYWLLVPFQLVWDTGLNISEPIKEIAPISKTEMNKITLTYSEKGGYTPGDAYDIYYGSDYLIKEWIFREGNSNEPSMITTFENYKDFNGIKIALDHKKADTNWNLNFTNIKIELDQD